MKTIVLQIMLFLLAINTVKGQEDSNNKHLELDLIFGFGFSYGIQSLSIPPLQNKVSAGLELSKGHFSAYLLPGFTGGIAPAASLHIESGIKYYFLTFDSSANWDKIGGSDKIFRNVNLNLGLRFSLNPKGDDDLSIWLKGGKSFYESGYDNDRPPTWGGKNVELKIIYIIANLK